MHHSCIQCKGVGRIGTMFFSRKCPECNGSGRMKCPKNKPYPPPPPPSKQAPENVLINDATQIPRPKKYYE